jgi:hypothetical protein
MSTAIQEQTTKLNQEAAAWAGNAVWFEDAVLMTDRPWAQTWRLEYASSRFYLKLLPESQALALDAMPLLQKQFPGVVPEVLAIDRPRGWLLLADHGGKTPRSGMDESVRVQLLETYARLQAEASGNNQLIEALPTLNPTELLARFLDYLNPAVSKTNCVGADFYLGESEAQSFYQRLMRQAENLAQQLSLYGEMPQTINHCDLRRSNMALAADGQVMIYDWDEAVAAPAGMSLHNFFSGCSQVTKLLSAAGGAVGSRASSRKIRRMNSYVGRLVRHGYADAETIRLSLPASVCAGVLRYLQSYSAFPRDDSKYRQVVGNIHRDRLNDLVEMCKWIESQPSSGSPQVQGSSKSSTHESRESVSETQTAVSGHPSYSEEAELVALEREAEHPDRIPTLRFNEDEIRNQEMSVAKLKLATRLFKRFGTLLIENAFEPELVDRLSQEYFRDYSRYSQHQRHADALKVGSRRYMVTIELAGAFNDPAVYAPSLVLPVIRGILGEKMILGSLTAVTSLGGSKDMHIHKDHPALFSRREVDHELPSFGVSVILPLLGFSEQLGTTRIWKGSHKISLKESLKTPHQDPYSSKGSCLLMDYRLTHQGLANRTDRVRPILAAIYQRPWFRDIANYGQQEALIMSDSAREKVPEQYQSLLAAR